MAAGVNDPARKTMLAMQNRDSEMADDTNVGTAIAAEAPKPEAVAVAKPEVKAEPKVEPKPAETEVAAPVKAKPFWDARLAKSNEEKAQVKREKAALESELKGEIAAMNQKFDLLVTLVGNRQAPAPADGLADDELAQLDKETDELGELRPAARVSKQTALKMKAAEKSIADLQRKLAEREARESVREKAETQRGNREALNELLSEMCVGDDLLPSWEFLHNPLIDEMAKDLPAAGYTRDRLPGPKTGRLMMEKATLRLKLRHMAGKGITITPTGGAPQAPASSTPAPEKKGVVVPEEPPQPQAGLTLDDFFADVKAKAKKGIHAIVGGG